MRGRIVLGEDRGGFDSFARHDQRDLKRSLFLQRSYCCRQTLSIRGGLGIMLVWLVGDVGDLERGEGGHCEGSGMKPADKL